MRKIILPNGRIVRRVVSVDEVRPVGQDAHETINIFRYSYETDSFSPTTPEEVLERSFRLKQIAASFGWTLENVLGGLTSRAGYIASAITRGEFSAEDLSSLVRRYVAREYPRELQRTRS